MMKTLSFRRIVGRKSKILGMEIQATRWCATWTRCWKIWARKTTTTAWVSTTRL